MSEPYTICAPSEKQEAALKELQDGNNVVILSVAGSGKTTTLLNATMRAPAANVFSLTYNAKLKTETRKKAALLGLSLDANSFHSFCVKYYNPKCFTDVQINALVTSDTKPLRMFAIDLLIVDEGQDMTPSYFALICKICRDSTSGPPQLLILGDRRQAINQFNAADDRFLAYADRLFTANLRPWKFLTNDESYRVTVPTANFVNYCMLGDRVGKETIYSAKTHIVPPNWTSPVSVSAAAVTVAPIPIPVSVPAAATTRATTRAGTTYSPPSIPSDSGTVPQIIPEKQGVPAPKPKYIICNSFGDDPMLELLRYLDQGYSPGDILVTAPSIKSAMSPIRQLENKLKRERPDIQVYVPTDDNERLDLDVLSGKLVFSTFHQTKGLEWPIVFVMGFDNSYFEYIARDLNPSRCPNTLYVSATRALHQVVLIHHNENDYLPFLDTIQLRRVCDVVVLKGIQVKRKGTSQGEQKTAVTDLVRHLPQTVIDDCVKMLTLQTTRRPTSVIEIATKSTQDNGGVENVSEITGTAIPLYYDLLRNGSMSAYDELLKMNFEALLVNPTPGLVNYKEGSGFLFTDNFVASAATNKPVDQNLGQTGEWEGCAFSQDSDDEVTPPPPPSRPSSRRAPVPVPVPVPTPLVAGATKPYHLSTIDINALTPAELLYIANCWCAYMSGIIFKVFQIKRYDWVPESIIDRCIDRIDSLGITSAGKYEKKISAAGLPELAGRTLVGVVDCFDRNNLYEFKCVTALASEHVLQTALYMYILNVAAKKQVEQDAARRMNVFHPRGYSAAAPVSVQPDYVHPGKLYNILTDELVEVANDVDAIADVVRVLIDHKYGPKKTISDDAFCRIHSTTAAKFLVPQACV